MLNGYEMAWYFAGVMQVAIREGTHLPRSNGEGLNALFKLNIKGCELRFKVLKPSLPIPSRSLILCNTHRQINQRLIMNFILKNLKINRLMIFLPNTSQSLILTYKNSN